MAETACRVTRDRRKTDAPTSQWQQAGTSHMGTAGHLQRPTQSQAKQAEKPEPPQANANSSTSNRRRSTPANYCLNTAKCSTQRGDSAPAT
ncbi:Hypothetical predicted protein [Pelobates cultripes]|uniref:Uncharacterized protein n=1 Tax=Pelobates cultripes TaxID=61616 RepID=A0AAD1TKQ6_PELCU|nr:Hypothetical predicted protein [Pelobates cultripes]